jgi:hypothetical protein
MIGERNLQKQERHEVQESFAQFNKIFDLAEKKLSKDASYDNYTIEKDSDTENIIELPSELQELVKDFPGKKYLVYYINRQSTYYTEGTRFKCVGLSTVKRKSQTDEVMREIEFRETEPSMGSKKLMIVSEYVNEKSFEKLNLAAEDETDQPHGEAKIEFELVSDYKKRMTNFSSSRLDEAFFDWNGEQKPVRWVRNLSMDNVSQEINYNDLYIIGRNHEGRDERAEINIKVKGDISSPSSILIKIGTGSPHDATVNFEDESKGIKIVTYKPYPAYKNQMEILKHDPNYSFLFRENIDVKEIISTMQSKVGMLRDDWRNPRTVFSGGMQLEHKSVIGNV